MAFWNIPLLLAHRLASVRRLQGCLLAHRSHSTFLRISVYLRSSSIQQSNQHSKSPTHSPFHLCERTSLLKQEEQLEWKRELRIRGELTSVFKIVIQTLPCGIKLSFAILSDLLWLWELIYSLLACRREQRKLLLSHLKNVWVQLKERAKSRSVIRAAFSKSVS